MRLVATYLLEFGERLLRETGHVDKRVQAVTRLRECRMTTCCAVHVWIQTIVIRAEEGIDFRKLETRGSNGTRVETGQTGTAVIIRALCPTMLFPNEGLAGGMKSRQACRNGQRKIEAINELKARELNGAEEKRMENREIEWARSQKLCWEGQLQHDAEVQSLARRLLNLPDEIPLPTTPNDLIKNPTPKHPPPPFSRILHS